MASKILTAALLASAALGGALPNGPDVANVEVRELSFARGAADPLVRPAPEPVKRSPQEDGGGEDFSFGDYETQEDFWAEWDTLEAFLEEHAGKFESEDDFWQQLEAALPTEGGSGEPFSFADYENQEDFWAEWDTVEAFLEEHADQFETEEQFWEEFEAALPTALPTEGSTGGGEENSGEIPGEAVPEVPDEEVVEETPGP